MSVKNLISELLSVSRRQTPLNRCANSCDRCRKLETRIRCLETALTQVLKTARGDGREATTPEHQDIMRMALSVLHDKE